MRTLKLPVVITPGKDGYFVAEIPILPGCISQGKTKKEALKNIVEAAELCLECQSDEGWIQKGSIKSRDFFNEPYLPNNRKQDNPQ